MIIKFSEFGTPIPDAQAESFVRQAIAEKKDVHISNVCVFDWFRAVLLQISPEQRPFVTWVVQDVELVMDEDFRSNFKFDDIDTGMEALTIILEGRSGQKWYSESEESKDNEWLRYCDNQ